MHTRGEREARDPVRHAGERLRRGRCRRCGLKPRLCMLRRPRPGAPD
jgi:hypothetical protein